MADSKITVTYFDFSGRAECIRLVLTYAGKEFVDNRIKQEQWPGIKPKSPFGQLPFVEIDGKVYGQSLALANFFAREFNLYGKSNLDSLKIDQLAQLNEDYIQEVVKVFREPDAEKKAAIEKNIKEVVAPKFWAFYERLLKENNGQYFVGQSVTLADLIAYDAVTGFIKTYAGPLPDSYPLLKALVEKIGSNNNIAAYKAKHP
ncbi:unnamed protein product [Candidula unifasciata]|uniref:Glutathione S-transferase n=1 Tax=Candidula unifasciata TaxID=100452 RepID=A0A8S3ZJ38_9EUPU|nr:unnamed protein product [Candidula unifasciata]